MKYSAPVAKVQQTCVSCGKPIPVGQRYIRTVFFPGEVDGIDTFAPFAQHYPNCEVKS